MYCFVMNKETWLGFYCFPATLVWHVSCVV